MKNNTTTKKVRHVFGRMRNVECDEGVFTFEMRKDGVHCRKRNYRTVMKVDFATLAEGGVRPVKVEEGEYYFVLGKEGLTIHGKGFNDRRMISYQHLFNMSQKQPKLL